MKIKAFGKTLFEYEKGSSQALYNTALDGLEKSEFLIDFYRDTGSDFNPSDWGAVSETILSTNAVSTGSAILMPADAKKTEKKPESKAEVTPKGVYQMKTLNDDGFIMKADPKYVDEQLLTFKEKLTMIKTKNFDMNRGTVEIGSIISRLENRKKYKVHEKFYSEFPYTSSAKIADLIKNEAHLKVGEISQFIADLPKEAVDVMKRYTDETKILCSKKPVFYIIANKKDFQKTQSRRDPILLAQSPFGHFWQILGAWDEEMLLLEDL